MYSKAKVAFHEKKYDECKNYLLEGESIIDSLNWIPSGSETEWIPSSTHFRDSFKSRLKNNLKIVSLLLMKEKNQNDLSLVNWIPPKLPFNDSGITATKATQSLEYNRALILFKEFKYQECLGIFSNEFLFKQSQTWFVHHADPRLYLAKIFLLYEAGFHLQRLYICVKMTERLDGLFRVSLRNDIFDPLIPDATPELKKLILNTLQNRLGFLRPNTIPLISPMLETSMISKTSSFIQCFASSICSMNICASLDDQKTCSKYVVIFRDAFKSPIHESLYFYYLALLNMEAKKTTAASAFAKRAIESCAGLDELFSARLKTLLKANDHV